MKVSQFSPTLFAAWDQALEGTLRVKTGKGEEGRKAATHLRYRLYMLRSAMGRENHPKHQALLRARLTIRTDRNGDYFVEGSLADKSLEQLLEASGVSVPDAPDIPEDL